MMFKFLSGLLNSFHGTGSPQVKLLELSVKDYSLLTVNIDSCIASPTRLHAAVMFALGDDFEWNEIERHIQHIQSGDVPHEFYDLAIKKDYCHEVQSIGSHT